MVMNTTADRSLTSDMFLALIPLKSLEKKEKYDHERARASCRTVAKRRIPTKYQTLHGASISKLAPNAE